MGVLHVPETHNLVNLFRNNKPIPKNEYNLDFLHFRGNNNVHDNVHAARNAYFCIKTLGTSYIVIKYIQISKIQ